MMRWFIRNGAPAVVLLLATLVLVWPLPQDKQTPLARAEEHEQGAPLILHTTDGRNLLGLSEQQSISKTIKRLQSIPPVPKLVALTFDDGPHPVHTPRLLNILHTYNVPATFFTLGYRVDAAPDIAKQIVAGGHQIGNHSYDHHITKGTSVAAIRNQILLTDEAIFNATGIRPTIFRPPGGWLSENVEQGSTLPIIMWSLDTRDWESRDANTVTQKVIDNVLPGDVILLHDIYESSVLSVETIIQALRAKGYKFVTINELFDFDEPSDDHVYYYSDLQHVRSDQ